MADFESARRRSRTPVIAVANLRVLGDSGASCLTMAELRAAPLTVW
jgi:hypothetical protein